MADAANLPAAMAIGPLSDAQRGAPAPVALGPEDRAILALESPTVAGHTCKVLLLGPNAPSIAQLRERIAQRIELTPALTRKLGETNRGAAAWVVDSDFDPSDHVVEHYHDHPVDHAELRTCWRIAPRGTVAKPTSRSARGHRPRATPGRSGWPPSRPPARDAGAPSRARRRPSATAGARGPGAARTGAPRALRHWVQLHHGDLGSIRVKVPVSLHRDGDGQANRDSMFFLGLPLGEPDPVVRLRTIHARTQARKLHSLAEISEHHALRVSVISLADLLCFGFCADPDVVPHVQSMATHVEHEARALLGALTRV